MIVFELFVCRYMMLRSPYLNVVSRSCYQGVQNGIQTNVLWQRWNTVYRHPNNVHFYSSWCSTAYQMMGQKRRAGAPISQRQSCTNSAHATKRALKNSSVFLGLGSGECKKWAHVDGIEHLLIYIILILPVL
jgi:hypothetical protein